MKAKKFFVILAIIVAMVILFTCESNKRSLENMLDDNAQTQIDAVSFLKDAPTYVVTDIMTDGMLTIKQVNDSVSTDMLLTYDPECLPVVTYLAIGDSIKANFTTETEETLVDGRYIETKSHELLIYVFVDQIAILETKAKEKK